MLPSPYVAYTLFQNGQYFSGLLFAFKLALAASIQKNIFPWTRKQGLICKQTKEH